jgi:hypothetical protein
MILRCADRPYRACTDESKETLRRPRLLSPHMRTHAPQHKRRSQLASTLVRFVIEAMVSNGRRVLWVRVRTIKSISL